MAALCIVEEPLSEFAYTKAIAPHTGGVFERVGFIAPAPVSGLETETCQRLEPGKPVTDYTHFLLVGSPEFIAKQPTPEGWQYGAYVLADSPFIPVEQTAWLDRIPRVSGPSAMTGGALQLAYGKPIAFKDVLPWGFPTQERHILNKTEIRQLIVPEWDHTAPVVLAYAEFADVMCAVMSRAKNVNLLLLGTEDTGHALRLDLHGVKPENVRFTTSTLAWSAADIYLALNTFTAWPWDVIHALARQLPVAAIRTHVYETLIDGSGCVGAISAFDSVSVGQKIGYQANSTDIAQALSQFTSDPLSLHVRAQVASATLAAHTPERFARRLIKTLFGE